MLSPVVQVGATRQQACGDREMAPGAGEVESRGAIRVAGVDVRTCSAQNHELCRMHTTQWVCRL